MMDHEREIEDAPGARDLPREARELDDFREVVGVAFRMDDLLGRLRGRLVEGVHHGPPPLVQRRVEVVPAGLDRAVDRHDGVTVGERVVIKGQRSLTPDAPLQILEGLEESDQTPPPAAAEGGA